MLPATPGITISREHLSRELDVIDYVTSVNVPMLRGDFRRVFWELLVALFLENAPSEINYLKKLWYRRSNTRF